MESFQKLIQDEHNWLHVMPETRFEIRTTPYLMTFEILKIYIYFFFTDKDIFNFNHSSIFMVF